MWNLKNNNDQMDRSQNFYKKKALRRQNRAGGDDQAPQKRDQSRGDEKLYLKKRKSESAKHNDGYKFIIQP